MTSANRIVIAVYLLMAFCCPSALDKEIKIKDTEVLKESLVLRPVEGKWYYHDEPFSGFATIYNNAQKIEKTGYFKGKREGISQKWYDNGTLKSQTYYKANNKEGTEKTWSIYGHQVSESNFVDGIANGEQLKWHSNGLLAQKQNIIDGKESGQQQAWLTNGKIYVNYEAKNGRIFGLKKANLCYELDNEIIQYKD
jgi:antitoxin component YwqK of YwqJK toxin-antitoxin module